MVSGYLSWIGVWAQSGDVAGRYSMLGWRWVLQSELFPPDDALDRGSQGARPWTRLALGPSGSPAPCRLRDLFVPDLLRNTLVGLALATIGLATFWGVHVYGKELLRAIAERQYLADFDPSAGMTKGEFLKGSPGVEQTIKNWEMLAMFLVTTGGGIGLLSFGPICERIGRRATFLFFHIGGLATALIVSQGMSEVSPAALCWMLPLFGFMTLGMHAGYAIYFPELYPTRLRSSGVGFCYNVSRVISAGALFGSAYLVILLRRLQFAEPFRVGSILITLIYFVGLVALIWAPETKGRPLPED